MIERGSCQHGRQRPGGDHLAAVLARAWPDIEHPVGRPNRLLVVLDDDQRVAQIAQPGEGRDQLGVVLLVQADRRLVEDVQHAHQRRSDLGRQPDALRLSAGQRRRRPIDGQVIEPDVDQEANPGTDLLEHLARDLALTLRQAIGQHLGPLERLGNRQLSDLGDVSAVDGHAERLGLQARAGARRARPGNHVALELVLDPFRVRLAVAPLEIGQQPFEGRVVVVGVAAVLVADAHLLAARRVEQVVEVLLGQLAERHVRLEAARSSDGLDHLAVPRVAHRHARPGQQSALGDRQLEVDDALLVELHAHAQAGAGRARAVRRVERERARLELVERGAVERARVTLAVALLIERAFVGRRDDHHPLAEPQ